jgi:putative ABC transport system permease protein
LAGFQLTPEVFVPDAQSLIEASKAFISWYPTCIILRTAQDPLGVGKSATEAVRRADPSVPIGRIQSMDEVLSNSIGLQRFLMTLMSTFAGLALVLASIGIYGAIAYSVTQRAHEIGIRLALGASRSDVLKSVVQRGMLLTLVGILFGLVGTTALTRLLVGQLYEVKPTDPRALAIAVSTLALTALFACWIPARRASSVDPVVTLRCESR